MGMTDNGLQTWCKLIKLPSSSSSAAAAAVAAIDIKATAYNIRRCNAAML